MSDDKRGWTMLEKYRNALKDFKPILSEVRALECIYEIEVPEERIAARELARVAQEYVNRFAMLAQKDDEDIDE